MAARDVPANTPEPAVTMTGGDMMLPTVQVPGDGPVKTINGDKLRVIGDMLSKKFIAYRSDRAQQEQRWLRNLRQYLGFYDPEVEGKMAADRSKAYPKITRVKCISVLSRIMDLMFPSDESNWTISARASADMDAKEVMKAIQERQQADAADNGGQPPTITEAYVQETVHKLAEKRAAMLTMEIKDQLEELGGDQTYDYVQLNSEVSASAILYGLGILRGPFLREVSWATWKWDATKQQPIVARKTKYMPQFDHMSIWDFYPDFSAKRLDKMDGYFERRILTRKDLREHAKDENFFGKVITAYLRNNKGGNYKPQSFETELRDMGITAMINVQKGDTYKYEALIWHGPIDATDLADVGVSIPKENEGDMIDAEIWFIDNYVIKAIMNPWAELKVDVRTLHTFLFDKDDTSPIGFGLPNVMRDTQMSISATARMILDNASVTCGPILEMNTNLLRPDQDLKSIHAYRVFYRNDDGVTMQYPAIREIKVESHVQELQLIMDMFMKLGDIETFVGPATGGDMERMPSEPMRNAAGASMLMGNAALPFKQIIRNFDNFTRSVIQSVIQFNRQFNSDVAQPADYDVIARGATSLIAKEVRGIQIDALSQSMKPEEAIHVNMRKFVEARFKARDLDGMLDPEDVVAKRMAAQSSADQMDKQLQQAGIEANTRNLLSQAFKNIMLANKSQAAAQAEQINSALAVLEKGSSINGAAIQGLPAGAGGVSAGGAAPAAPDQPAAGSGDGAAGVPGGLGALQAGGGVGPALDPGSTGGGAGLPELPA